MNKEPILLLFGHNVQKYRKELGLSQERLAELAGVHRTYIGMVERAEKNITLCNIEKIAKALNVEIKDLFQIGCIGLIKAIDNFDLTQGVQFSTYAVPMIIRRS